MAYGRGGGISLLHHDVDAGRSDPHGLARQPSLGARAEESRHRERSNHHLRGREARPDAEPHRRTALAPTERILKRVDSAVSAIGGTSNDLAFTRAARRAAAHAF